MKRVFIFVLTLSFAAGVFELNASCLPPTYLRIFDHSAAGTTITWESTNTPAEENWIVSYRNTSISVTWQDLPVSINSITLSGFTTLGSYEIRVRAVCDGGVNSSYSDILAFSSVISNEQELSSFRDRINNGTIPNRGAGMTFLIVADIPLTSNWTPITEFRGTLNGNFHKLINLQISNGRGFVVTLNGGTIKNLGIESGSITSSSDAGTGSFAGICENNGTVEACYNKANVNCTNTGPSFLGGIVGNMRSGNIRYCYNQGTVNNNGNQTGGIIGRSSDVPAKVIHCYNRGTVLGNNYVAGVAGRIQPVNNGSLPLILENSYNRGLLTRKLSCTVSTTSITCAAYIAHSADNSRAATRGRFENCYGLQGIGDYDGEGFFNTGTTLLRTQGQFQDIGMPGLLINGHPQVFYKGRMVNIWSIDNPSPCDVNDGFPILFYQVVPCLVITSPAADTAICSNEIEVSFKVSNFVLGTDGKLVYFLNGIPKGSTVTQSPVLMEELNTGVNLIQLALVDAYRDTVAREEVRVTVKPVYEKDTIREEICKGNSYFFGGKYIEETGVYKDTFPPTTLRCDSIITLILTVSLLSDTTIYDTICSSNLPYTLNGFNASTEDIHEQTVRNSSGCDSTIYLHLKILDTLQTFIRDSICYDEIYNKHGFTENATGTYYLFLQSSYNCDSTVILNLTVLPKIVVELPPDRTFCENDFTPYVIDAYIGDDYDYEWNTEDKTPQLRLETEGIYTVTVANVLNCKATGSHTLKINPYPNMEIISHAIDFCESYMTILEAITDGLHVVWNTGTTGNILEVHRPGFYTAEAFIGNCKSSAHLLIGNCACEIYIPNSFSPNGDGINDYFYPEFFGSVTDVEMAIYDRMGNQVYYTLNTPWDGKYKGKVVPWGAYTYIIRYRCPEKGNALWKKTGVVTVLF